MEFCHHYYLLYLYTDRHTALHMHQHEMLSDMKQAQMGKNKQGAYISAPHPKKNSGHSVYPLTRAQKVTQNIYPFSLQSHF